MMWWRRPGERLCWPEPCCFQNPLSHPCKTVCAGVLLGFWKAAICFGERAFSFHLPWQNFNTSAFHLNKNSMSGGRGLWWNDLFRMQKTHSFSCIWGEGSIKLLLMKNKSSNSMCDITMKEKIRTVVFFLTIQNDIRIKFALTLSYSGNKELPLPTADPHLGDPRMLRPALGPHWVNVWGISDWAISVSESRRTLLFAAFVLSHL